MEEGSELLMGDCRDPESTFVGCAAGGVGGDTGSVFAELAIGAFFAVDAAGGDTAGEGGCIARGRDDRGLCTKFWRTVSLVDSGAVLVTAAPPFVCGGEFVFGDEGPRGKRDATFS